MSTVGELSVVIEANTAKLEAALSRVENRIKKSGKEVRKNTKDWDKWASRAKAANLAVIASITLGAAKVITYGDAFTSMTNKLKLATDGTEDLARTTAKMFEIANETRTDVEATTILYTKMERATRNLGLSQERLQDITGSVNKAFALSGASASETSGSIRQLGQALASGALRGDEFNSIAEQAPIIMEAVSAATGNTAGELRTLAAEGLITADILIKSLEGYADTINKEYATSQATFEQKTVMARNAAIEFVSASDEIKASVELAGDAVLFLADNMDVIVKVGKLAAMVYGVVLTNSLWRAVAPTIALNVATAKTIVTQLAATGSSRRLTVAMLRLNKAMKANPAMFIASAAAMLLFVDWTTDAEDSANDFKNEVLGVTDALAGMNEEQRSAANRQFIKDTNDVTAAINLQKEALKKARENQAKDPMSIGNTTAVALAVSELDALIAKRLELQKIGNEAFNLKINMDMEGADDPLETINLLNAKIAAAQAKADAKRVEALTERLKSDLELENSNYEKDLAALQRTSALKIAEMEKAGKSSAEFIAAQGLLEAKLKTQHEENITAIQLKAEEDRKAALLGTKEQQDDQKFLSDLQDRLKSAADLEDARAEEEKIKMQESAAFKLLSKDEQNALLQEQEAEHQAIMKAINGEETFADELMERFATESQLQMAKYASDLQQLRDFLASKAELTDAERSLEAQLTADHEKEMTRIKQAEQRAQVGIMTSTMGAISQALSQGGKKMQAIGKKIAIARAVLAGGQAAVDAWRSGMETGGPWAPVVAAAYTAASLARTGSMISSIKGNSKPSSGGGVARPTVPSGSPAGGGSEDSGGGGNREISINMVGKSMFSSDQVRELIGQINEQVGDGVQLSTGEG